MLVFVAVMLSAKRLVKNPVTALSKVEKRLVEVALSVVRFVM